LALKTTLAQLEEVQAAITKILEGGQDVMNSDKRILYARLEALQKREEYLLNRYNAEQGEGTTVRNTGLIKR
jgi:restriction endonuclease S subunit